MNQVSMSSVNLNDSEARFTGTTCCGGKSRNDVLNTIDRERSGHRIVISESHGAWGNDVLPTPLTLGDRPMPCPRRVSAGFATGMRQLHPSHAALLMNKADDARQRLNVIVHPNA